MTKPIFDITVGGGGEDIICRLDVGSNKKLSGVFGAPAGKRFILLLFNGKFGII